MSLWWGPRYQFITLELFVFVPKGENYWELTLPRPVTHCSPSSPRGGQDHAVLGVENLEDPNSSPGSAPNLL